MQVRDLDVRETAAETGVHMQSIRSGGTQRFETQHRTKDGRILDIEVSATYLPGSNCFLAVIRDISERKQAERRLADALELNKTIIAASPIGILAYDAAGGCMLANPASADLVGAPTAQLLSQNYHMLAFWKSSGLYDAALAVIASGSPAVRGVHIRTTFGVERWVQATLTTFTSQGQQHLLVLLLDVTEQRQALVAAQEHVRVAEELARMRNEFAATVSHELRSPLTAVIGYSEMVEARWEALTDPVRHHYLRRIVQAANRQHRLVEDLLLLSRLEESDLRLKPETVEVTAAISRAADEVRANYPEQEIAITAPPDLCLHADPERLQQILVNLMDNAAKYSPAGAPISVAADFVLPLAADARAGPVAIRVRDAGPGVSSAGRERLFQRFGRLEGSRSRSGHVGTGLGLYLSRRLAHAMCTTASGYAHLAPLAASRPPACLPSPCASRFTGMLQSRLAFAAE